MSSSFDYNPTPAPVQQNSNLAIISLIAGVVGWLGILVIGPLVAIITGHMAKNEIRASGGRLGGDGLATAGLVLGYLNIGLSVLAICLFIVLPLLGLGGVALCAPFANNFQ